MKMLRYMKLCHATQLHMLVLEIVSHGDMKMCRMILFIKGKQQNLYYLHITNYKFILQHIYITC